MNHDEAKALIREIFADGDVESSRSLELRAHLRQCEACRALYDRWAEAEEVLGEAHASSASAERAWPSVDAVTRPASRRWWLGAAGAAAAALVGLAVWPSEPDGPIVEYGVEISPIQKKFRSTEPAEDQRVVIGRRGRFTLLLRPDVPTTDRLVAAAFWVGEEVTKANFTWARSEQGSIRFEGAAADAVPEPGPWTLVVFVGRDDAEPSLDAVRQLATTTSSSARSEHEFAPSIRKDDRRVFVIPMIVK